MNLKIQAPRCSAFTPSEDLAGKKLIARRSKHAHVSGDLYRKRHLWVRICEFVAASRGPSVMGKASFESRHYVQAAITRKANDIKKRAQNSGENLSPTEFKKAVFNSKGVQNRTLREDFVRFNRKHYSKEAGANGWNRAAFRASRVAHGFHSVCEMFAAPTGMTSNLTRNLVMKKPDESSTRNKVSMLLSLGFIGVATTELVSWIQKKFPPEIQVAGKSLGKELGGVVVAFSMVSAAMGAFGTLSSWIGQTLVRRQEFSDSQTDAMQSELNSNLQKLVYRLKSVKNNPQAIKMMGQAMNGKRFLLKKVSGSALDSTGTPKILRSALQHIDMNASDTDNMKSLFEMAGQYMHVDKKPDGKNSSLWSRFSYCREVRAKEREWVAMLGLIEHIDIQSASKSTKDYRKILEDDLVPNFHTWMLKQCIPVAKLFDKVFPTSTARRLEKWTSPLYLKCQNEKNSNPLFAAQRAYSAAYMVKHRHQYGPITRCFITLSEGMRMVNMNLVLACNANLSRGFNNVFHVLHEMLGTSPAARTICNSLGRTFGGAALSAIFGILIPYVEGKTGDSSSYDFSVGKGEDVTLSAKNIGILMTILAAPTLLCQLVATISARLEGWKGDIHDSVNKKDVCVRW